MQTIDKLLGGCSQIIGRIYPPPPPPGFGTLADRHADIFTDLMFEFGNMPLISKPTRISTVMTLLGNIREII